MYGPSAMEPEPEPDLTIVLLGNSGVGKSASGNTILGRAAFMSRASFSPSSIPVRQEVGRVFGTRVRVVDTAGILEFEEQIQFCCQEVQRTSRAHLFLLVLKLDRFTQEQNRAVEASLRAVGGEGFDRCFLLFTHGDALKDASLREAAPLREAASLRDAALRDFVFRDKQSSLPEVARRFYGRMHLFNNEDGGGQQVQELLDKAGHLLLPAGLDQNRTGILQEQQQLSSGLTSCLVHFGSTLSRICSDSGQPTTLRSAGGRSQLSQHVALGDDPVGDDDEEKHCLC